jgi:tetraacyldisaccharide 4'-kinase
VVVLTRGLAQLYGAVALARRRRIERHPHLRRRLHRPVISVGNLAVGGRGKTPLVAAIATLLRDLGERPSILSRGYGRTRPREGAVVVRDAQHVRADLAAAGDEPLMLARRLDGIAVVVGADRHLAGRLAETHLGCTVHVLDDGFQHLLLARDIDLLLVTPADLRDGRTMPAGRLREPVAAAARADALLVAGGAPAEIREVANRLGVEQVFGVEIVPGAPTAVEPFGTPPPAPREAPVVAVAGIARPERFFASLSADGWNVVDRIVYRDHHPYGRRDVARLRARVEQTGAALVLTTEKDLVRWLPLRPLPFPLAWIPIKARIEPADGFGRWLAERLGAASLLAAVRQFAYSEGADLHP